MITGLVSFRNRLIRLKYGTHFSLSDISKAIIDGTRSHSLDPSRWVMQVDVYAVVAQNGGISSKATDLTEAHRSAILLLKGRGGSWAIEQIACMYADALCQGAGADLAGAISAVRLHRPAPAIPQPAAPRPSAPSPAAAQAPLFLPPDDLLDPSTGRMYSFADPALLATFSPAEKAAIDGITAEAMVQILRARADGTPALVASAGILARMRTPAFQPPTARPIAADVARPQFAAQPEPEPEPVAAAVIPRPRLVSLRAGAVPRTAEADAVDYDEDPGLCGDEYEEGQEEAAGPVEAEPVGAALVASAASAAAPNVPAGYYGFVELPPTLR
jgi:hypothetical protein